MKYVLVIGDGIADRPLPALEGRTPLQASRKSTIDALARRSEVGLVRTVPEGVPPGSDTAILSIFGYDPRTSYTGRSPLEAAGTGHPLRAGSLSLRCNLVSLRGDGAFASRRMASHSGGNIEGDEALTLARDLMADEAFAALMREARMDIITSPTFRQIAVFDDAPEGDMCTVPPHDILERGIAEHLPTGELADTLCRAMALAADVLSRHPINAARVAAGKLPANGVWFWGEGRAVALPSFASRYGARGGVVSAVPLVKGIATLAGLDAPDVAGANGEIETNYRGKVDAALHALETEDFAGLHVEAPDECSHAGDLPGKIRAIEYLDERLMRPLLEGLRALGDFRLLFLSDHATPIATRTHADDPVPFLIYDSRRDVAGARAYDEEGGAQGPYVHEGSTIMGRLFEKG